MDLIWLGLSKDFMTSGGPGAKVNYVYMAGGGTGTGPTIFGYGTDTNVDLTLAGKGSGNVILGSTSKRVPLS